MPNTFYKYATFATAEMVVRNRTLRWTTPATLNDPFDMRFDLHVDFDRNAVRTSGLQKIWDSVYNNGPVSLSNQLGGIIAAFRGVFPRLTRDEFDIEFGQAIDEGLDRSIAILTDTQTKVREFLARTKILCLSATRDNTLMWSHYAGNHTGLVLEFGDAPGLDSPRRLAKPVNYTDIMPKLGDDEFWSDLAAGRRSFDVSSLVDLLVYTKADDWAYEKEWRLQSGYGRDEAAPHEDIPFHREELNSVTFGCLVPEASIADLSSLVRHQYPLTKINKAQRSSRSFDLMFVDIT